MAVLMEFEPKKILVAGGGAAVLVVMAGLGSWIAFDGQMQELFNRFIDPVIEQHREDMANVSGRDDGQDERIQTIIGTMNGVRNDLEDYKIEAAAKRNTIEREAIERFLELMDDEADILQRLARLEALAGVNQ